MWYSKSSIRSLSSVRPFLAAVCVGMIAGSGCCLFPAPRPVEEQVWMEVTAYCSCRKCTGWERRVSSCFMPVYASGPSKGQRKKVGITSSGQKARRGTIAADIARYPFGTRMYVPGYGWGEVQDTGSGIQGNHIDLYFESHEEALQWGRRKLKVTIRRKR